MDSSSADSRHVGVLGLAGCWVSVKSQIIAKIHSATMDSLYLFMIHANFFLTILVW